MKGSNIISFVAGAAIGSLVAWKLLQKKCEDIAEKKYKDIADEEIESVKNAFKNRSGKTNTSQQEVVKIPDEVIKNANDIIAQEAKEKPGIESYKEYVKNYISDHKDEDNEEDEEEYEDEDSNVDWGDRRSDPYLIDPNEFGNEGPDYDCISLKYYADKVLTDDTNDVITNAYEIVGARNLRALDISNDEIIYVRNERLRCDYEIVYDGRTYSEVVGEG